MNATTPSLKIRDYVFGTRNIAAIVVIATRQFLLYF